MNSLKVLFVTFLVVGTAVLFSSCAPAAPSAQQNEQPLEVVKTVEVAKEGQQIAPTPTASFAQPAAPAVGPSAPSADPAAPSADPAVPAVEPLGTLASATQFAPAPAQPTSPAAELPSKPTIFPTPTRIIPTPSTIAEDHIVQVEWPARMRLGESDAVRLVLVSSSQGLTLVTEYPEHQTITQTVAIMPAPGYELFAVARLDGVGFTISPVGEQAQYLMQDQVLQWRWSLTPAQPGKHRVAISLTLRWIPVGNPSHPVREVIAYSRNLDIRVMSFFGLSQAQAMLTGLITLLLGSSLGMLAVGSRSGFPGMRQIADHPNPNPDLKIELPPNLRLNEHERSLLQSLFNRYSRLLIEAEFLSGYSGARTFLAVPLKSEGRADAYTIAKIGIKQNILREHRNYEQFVKDTLPPVTARIQRPPVISSKKENAEFAALQYTFIGEPGKPPVSLRKILLENPDPELIHLLLETFGPNWWLQRRPYSFWWGVEYDRVLPTHYVIEPDKTRGPELDARRPPAEYHFQIGDHVVLRHFKNAELRFDGASLSLQGISISGHPPLRVRWLNTKFPEGFSGRVVATRQTLLQGWINGFDLFGLPDPLGLIDQILLETVHSSQSIIHGDLNLENILVGPGNLLWLIDFAQTREGHSLFDLAHLNAEIIAHVVAEKVQDPLDFLQVLDRSASLRFEPFQNLLLALERASLQLLFNDSNPDEYRIPNALTCLGALKYRNLTPHAKHFLYLAAAHFLRRT